MIVNSETLSDAKPPVTVKGTRDGLLFLLDEQADMDHLCEYLHSLLFGETASIFDGPVIEVVVDYGKRTLTPKEVWRILGLFQARDNFLIKAWGGGQKRGNRCFNVGHQRGPNIFTMVSCAPVTAYV
ncbi:hypothetical protein GCM10025858_04010 [Alicyclobacillus sacchari]|uniref:hypothetical protein n=1 Tax=Alicyclobacillus sacchari TaxID=392010 RepID=UPI0023E9D691|nr:hypothetical protein [Alicyclobacillus sacchari]GMA55898.1 hypothetical protein GCM10025858_04010 [Alicyclobacillus sacchari]